MYKCNKCGNKIEFEEINVFKTHIEQDDNGNSDHYYITDEFIYRENVICLECNSTLEDGDIIEQESLE